MTGEDIEGILYFSGPSGRNSSGDSIAPSSIFISQTPQTAYLPTNNVFETSDSSVTTTFSGGFTIANSTITAASFLLTYGQYDYYYFDYKNGNTYENGFTGNFHQTGVSDISTHPVGNDPSTLFGNGASSYTPPPTVPEPSQWGIFVFIGALVAFGARHLSNFGFNRAGVFRKQG